MDGWIMVDFQVCFGSLSWCRGQSLFNFSFLTLFQNLLIVTGIHSSIYPCSVSCHTTTKHKCSFHHLLLRFSHFTLWNSVFLHHTRPISKCLWLIQILFCIPFCITILHVLAVLQGFQGSLVVLPFCQDLLYLSVSLVFLILS